MILIVVVESKMSRAIQVRKLADRKEAPASKAGKMTASEMRQKLTRLQRIVNGVNKELQRLGSYQIEPDN